MMLFSGGALLSGGAALITTFGSFFWSVFVFLCCFAILPQAGLLAVVYSPWIFETQPENGEEDSSVGVWGAIRLYFAFAVGLHLFLGVVEWTQRTFLNFSKNAETTKAAMRRQHGRDENPYTTTDKNSYEDTACKRERSFGFEYDTPLPNGPRAGSLFSLVKTVLNLPRAGLSSPLLQPDSRCPGAYDLRKMLFFQITGVAYVRVVLAFHFIGCGVFVLYIASWRGLRRLGERAFCVLERRRAVLREVPGGGAQEQGAGGRCCGRCREAGGCCGGGCCRRDREAGAVREERGEEQEEKEAEFPSKKGAEEKGAEGNPGEKDSEEGTAMQEKELDHGVDAVAPLMNGGGQRLPLLPPLGDSDASTVESDSVLPPPVKEPPLQEPEKTPRRRVSYCTTPDSDLHPRSPSLLHLLQTPSFTLDCVEKLIFPLLPTFLLERLASCRVRRNPWFRFWNELVAFHGRTSLFCLGYYYIEERGKFDDKCALIIGNHSGLLETIMMFAIR